MFNLTDARCAAAYRRRNRTLKKTDKQMTNTSGNRRNKLYWLIAAAIITASGTVAYRYWQSSRAAAAPKVAAPAIPVVTAVAREEDVPVYLSGIGNVTPLYSVTVKVRVDGQLDSVAFVEIGRAHV